MHSSPVVVVTGASAGLGRAIAHGYARRGAKLGLIARNPEALAAAQKECEQLGGSAVFIPTDVSDSSALEQAATIIEEQLGPIDIWVNDAMVSVFSPVKEMEASDYQRVTEVLYLGFVYGTMAALRRMLPRDRGTIIQIGSALSYRSIPLQSAYCAAKHAINGFTDSLRCELYHDKSHVRLTTVQMPAMNTTQFDWVKNRMPNNTQPVPPIFEPEVAAEVVVAAGLAKKPRREYWVGSPTAGAIVAQRLFPGLLDRYLGHNRVRPNHVTRTHRITCTTTYRGNIAPAASSMTARNAQALKVSLYCTGSGLPGPRCRLPEPAPCSLDCGAADEVGVHND
jgi:NAD(P)-dependent dehydrogenase (short-subunit alcohol dehydrogenase family)